MARSFDIELAQLESLRDADPATTLEPIRKALTSKNNFLVAKAAKLAALHNHQSLTEALVEAYPRFATDPSKTDPQCWAKEAILKTLAAFEYQEPELFLEGMRTFQAGATDDAATALRGLSAHALVQCRGLDSHTVLQHLLPLLADKQLPVQVNAARAIEQIGSPSAALLLRLRAELGSGAPELLGACYSGVLHLEGPGAIPWAARFLPKPREEVDIIHEEAALSIAETRHESAATLLIATYKRATDHEFRRILLTALALTRQDVAIEYLFTLIEEGNREAREALEDSAPSAAVVARLQFLGNKFCS